MRTLLVVFGVLISSQMQAQSRVLVEVQAPAQAYVSQPVEVVIRLGFDAEWFAPRTAGQQNHPVALLQLCTAKTCRLLRIRRPAAMGRAGYNQLDALPQSFLDVLADAAWSGAGKSRKMGCRTMKM